MNLDAIEKVTEQLRQYCKENGIDYDELVEGASKHFKGTLEEPRKMSQEEIKILAKDIAEMDELSTKRVEEE